MAQEATSHRHSRPKHLRSHNRYCTHHHHEARPRNDEDANLAFSDIEYWRTGVVAQGPTQIASTWPRPVFETRSTGRSQYHVRIISNGHQWKVSSSDPRTNAQDLRPTSNPPIAYRVGTTSTTSPTSSYVVQRYVQKTINLKGRAKRKDPIALEMCQDEATRQTTPKARKEMSSAITTVVVIGTTIHHTVIIPIHVEAKAGMMVTTTGVQTGGIINECIDHQLANKALAYTRRSRDSPIAPQAKQVLEYRESSPHRGPELPPL
ncbi:hypothetical protein O1611_g2765 [Lasiodiplodia mahajangana]|uniref:Uncharacterized protein n=1 Tax=Lasiodiplodia mahajangana TaxID=1108764 RepID=A0ACC2JTX7_9PEZI|nr:hypothetical protein O1611_g2765 [Lasiodiplodia mahajangana]